MSVASSSRPTVDLRLDQFSLYPLLLWQESGTTGRAFSVCVSSDLTTTTTYNMSVRWCNWILLALPTSFFLSLSLSPPSILYCDSKESIDQITLSKPAFPLLLSHSVHVVLLWLNTLKCEKSASVTHYTGYVHVSEYAWLKNETVCGDGLTSMERNYWRGVRKDVFAQGWIASFHSRHCLNRAV